MKNESQKKEYIILYIIEYIIELMVIINKYIHIE